ncbi:MAG: hypothetical protein ACREBW_00260, partial [Candidatus Micrarchaeaceae archaeon]
IYALMHARHKAMPLRSKGLEPQLNRMAAQVKLLNLVWKELYDYADPDPEMLYKNFRYSLNTYVNFFYAMPKEERKEYMSSISRMRTQKDIKPHENLLLIPALMAEKKEQRNNVTSWLGSAIYKAPFRALYDSSKTAMRIAMFKQDSAIKSASNTDLAAFSQVMARLDSRIKDIENGNISPIEDEALKSEFITEAIRFSDSTDVDLLDFISDRIDTRKVVVARATRMVRKGRN